MDSDAERRRRAGQEIKDRRGVLGNMTQRELAEKSGVDVSTLQEIESGLSERRHNLRTLSAISGALGWAPSRLRELLYGAVAPAERTDAIEADVLVLQMEVQDLRRMMDDLVHQFTDVMRRLPPGPADE